MIRLKKLAVVLLAAVLTFSGCAGAGASAGISALQYLG